MRLKRAKNCHFHTEIVNSELILTHLIWGEGEQTGRQENILGGNFPIMSPCGAATEIYW